jgi:hypothetical protein
MKDQIRQSEVLASRREAWKGLTDQSREAGNLQSKIYLRQKPADLSAVANTLGENTSGVGDTSAN